MAKELSLARLLQQKELSLGKGLYAVVGPEEFLHKSLVARLRRELGSVEVKSGDELDLEGFAQLLGSKTLFSKGPAASVLLKAESFFSKLRGKKQKEKVAALLRRPVGKIVVISITADLKKTDLAKEPYKTLLEAAAAVLKAESLPRDQLAALIRKKFQKAGITPQEGVVEYLLEVFPDLSALKTELEKLLTYAVGKRTLTLSEVKELVSGNPSYTVFDLQKAYFDRDLKRTLQTFKGLLEGLTAYERNALCLQLEGLLLATANRLLVAKERTQKGRKLKSFARELGLYYPFQVAQFEGWLQRWELSDLVKVLQALHRFDLAVKTRFLPAEEEMKKFFAATLA
ncbi:MAG: hypothetical protein GXO08_03650 [Aquificae bacterium]|nr:hypothetical protein [Aquificota bacterium]